MNTKLKSAILLLLTLFIGVVGGVLGSRLYLDHRMREFRQMRGEQLFQHRLHQLLDLTPEQIAAVDSVFKKYEPRLQATNRRFRLQTRSTLDSLHAELQPLLTEEQNKILKQRLHRGPMTRPAELPRRPRRNMDRMPPGHPPSEAPPPPAH